jgi:phosphopantothenoylcysteine decarboxylase/phosphopantothenate--cysteine ligase
MRDPAADKTILLGVTGSIAAYKAAEIASRLTQLGARVRAVMTRSATRFLAPLTLRSLTGHPVLEDMFADPGEWRVEHVGLAEEADLVLLAPASANAIAKLAAGLADELLYCLLLATRAPVLVAPAMDEGMYLHPATQANLERLERLGYQLIPPESGWLASGKTGKGRLASLETILEAVRSALGRSKRLAGKSLLITAGPTREPIDPVRFISNPSSGRMGYALAAAARDRGARVVLVSGPSQLAPPGGVELVPVTTTREMREAVLARLEESDCLIAAAAPCDFGPEEVAPEKIKKAGKERLSLELTRRPDILEEAARASGGRVLVGFAAETGNLIANARAKLKAKRLDLIVANDVSRADSGFAAETNLAALLFAGGRKRELPRLTKRALAEVILEEVEKLLERPRRCRAKPSAKRR